MPEISVTLLFLRKYDLFLWLKGFVFLLQLLLKIGLEFTECL